MAVIHRHVRLLAFGLPADASVLPSQGDWSQHLEVNSMSSGKDHISSVGVDEEVIEPQPGDETDVNEPFDSDQGSQIDPGERGLKNSTAREIRQV